jgi:hypothetical protein
MYDIYGKREIMVVVMAMVFKSSLNTIAVI